MAGKKKGSRTPFWLASFGERASGTAFQHVPSQKYPWMYLLLLLLLLLFIYCSWVCTQWQWSLHYTITTKNIQFQQQKTYSKNKYIP
jgi:hypothetical protein